MTQSPKKKLIEVSLPLAKINVEGAREKSIRHGHPSTLHLWWARRPLATARAVLFAQLVDDPSARPEEFPTTEEQDAERARLHELMERLVVWENVGDERLLQQVRSEIRKSNGGLLPSVLDPFAGGGSIPLEAQRLGLAAHASDLNPVAVLLNKAAIEIPPKFAGRSPVNPSAPARSTPWLRAEGLAEDVLLYGGWMRDQAEERLGSMYPKVKTPGGTEHTVIGWIWARTVKSPNPANPIETPIVSSWWVSKRKGSEAYVVPSIVDGSVHYEVRHDANGPGKSKDGTRVGRGAISVVDGTPISAAYLKSEGTAGRMGAHLIAIVAEGGRGRLYVSPNDEHIAAANVPIPLDVPDAELPYDPRNVWTPAYGLTRFSDLFTRRQLVALTTLTDLVDEARQLALVDAISSGLAPGARLEEGGNEAEAYADAVATYLALAVSKFTNVGSSLAGWMNDRGAIRETFARQSIAMSWDFVEVNPLGDFGGTFTAGLQKGVKVIQQLPDGVGRVETADAATRDYSNLVVSTDPPYYANIDYANLSDYFYVWLRRSLGKIHSTTVGTLLTPKADELVANPYRHDGSAGAEKFFVDGFNQVFERIRQTANTDVPMAVYYAYKEQETDKDGTSSTGWHTLLGGLIHAGWEITATWPVRTEGAGRMIARGTNALMTSNVLACRPRPQHAEATTRRAFVAALKAELPGALRTLMLGSIAPVDLDQAAYGPGIAIYSRYSRVREADGTDMTVRQALSLIAEITDEVRGEGISDMDPETRFAVKWYRQFGWLPEVSGTAISISQSVGTSLGALERGGIFEAKGGRARLLPPSQLDGDWDPETDERVSVWEATVRLAAVMAKDGADKVVSLLPSVQTRVNLDAVKELGFLLFHEAEKKRDTQDALLFNGLVSAWADVSEKARGFIGQFRPVQQTLDFDDEE